MTTTFKAIPVLLLALAVLLVYVVYMLMPKPATMAVSLPNISVVRQQINVTTYPVGGQMIDLSHVSFDLTPATKNVGGAYAYWNAENGCFFGIHTPFNWAANKLAGPCPEGPDDDVTIGDRIKELWSSFKSGSDYSWVELLQMGGDAAGHVNAIIELAKAYGVTLIP